MVAVPSLPMICRQEGLRTVLFGVSNVLLGTPQAETQALHELLFERLPPDPRLNPLSPLFKNDPGITGYAREFLPTFLADRFSPDHKVRRELSHSSWGDFCASLYDPYRGNEGIRDVLQDLNRGGIVTGVWADCLSGSTHIVRSLIDDEYPDLFAHHFFSTTHRVCVGEEPFLRKLLAQLGVTREEMLFVTGNLGHWSYAIREGIRTCFYRMFEGGEGPHPLRVSLLKSLGTTEDGSPDVMTDPVAYLHRINTFAEVARQSGAREALEEGSGERKSFELFTNLLPGHADAADKPSPLTTELRAAAIDWFVWTGNDSLPPLAPALQDLAIDPDLLLLPRYKTTEEMRRDLLRIFHAYWRQIEETPPALAKAAFSELTEEMGRLIAFRDLFEDLQELIPLLWKTFVERFSASRERLVERLGLFTALEWEGLTRVFLEDHSALDARYASWVTGVVQSVRHMVSLQQDDAVISDYVYKSLHTGLFWRILTMEMDFRERQEMRRPFLHRHDMRGVASVLILNRGMIEAGRTSWSTYARRGSVREWIETMLFPLIDLASPRNVHLEIAFDRKGKIHSIPLTAFSEAERDALGHVLIELVRNGIKYRDPGAAQSTVSVRVHETEGSLEIVVSDNGVGIQDTEKVWERGIRERPDLAEGDGDGLPSIMRHVSRWKWSIALDSKPDNGCAFRLVIPVRT